VNAQLHLFAEVLRQRFLQPLFGIGGTQLLVGSIKLEMQRIAVPALEYAVQCKLERGAAQDELRRVEEAEPPVVVLDLSLGDGSSVTQNVRAVLTSGSQVLVHSIADRVAAVREALAAGAAGVIPKSSPTSVVISAIATVARGAARNNVEWASAIEADQEFAKAQLGRRERDVLHLYASGLPLKLVAERLGIAHSTAREYLDRIRAKYVEVGRPAPTKVDLLRRAVEDGILPGLDADAGHAGP
jgi:DNA-binding NarL/FixJ family response regulator